MNDVLFFKLDKRGFTFDMLDAFAQKLGYTSIIQFCVKNQYSGLSVEEIKTRLTNSKNNL